MNRPDQSFEALCQIYRDSVGVPEAGANFMPKLWERIEGRRSFTFRLKRATQVFAGSALAICLCLTGVMFVPRAHSAQHPATYVDVLAEAQPAENLAAQGIVKIETPEAPEAPQ